MLPPLRADLALVEGYHSPQVEASVRLNTNESPHPPPEAWLRAFLAALGSAQLHRYPDRGAVELRRALADHHGLDPDQVLATKGSNEALMAMCTAYGGPGRQCLVFEPTYALHSHLPRLSGTEVVSEERGPGFVLDPARAVAAVERVRPAVTFLCSPNNPTGVVETPQLVEAVLGAAESVGGLLVVDEAYAQFSSWTALDLLDADRPLAVTRTYSKTWALAGMRLGYVLGPAALIADLERVLLPYHLDTATQLAGRLALDYMSEMAERVEAIVAERRRVSAALAALDVELWPSEANFVLFRPRARPGVEVWADLLRRSVLVRNCSWGPRLQGCLRVTIGSPDDNDGFLAAMEEVL